MKRSVTDYLFISFISCLMLLSSAALSTTLVSDIHFDAGGNLYGSLAPLGGGGSSFDFYAIDKSTGSGTLIGDIGFAAVSGLAQFGGEVPPWSVHEYTILAGEGMTLQIAPNAKVKLQKRSFFRGQICAREPEASQVSLKIFNIRGQLIRTITAGGFEAGFHQLQWDAINESGVKVASGMYFYKLQADDFIQVKKMMLLK